MTIDLPPGYRTATAARKLHLLSEHLRRLRAWERVQAGVIEGYADEIAALVRDVQDMEHRLDQIVRVCGVSHEPPLYVAPAVAE